MRIAIVNHDTSHGPRDVEDGRFGAAQLAPELLARALADRGHDVWRVSRYGDGCGAYGVKHGSAPGPFDAVIANRQVQWADGVDALTRWVWVHDAWGHNCGYFAERPDVHVVAVSRWQAANLASALPVPVYGIVPVGAPPELAEYPIEHGLNVYTCGMWVECRGTLRALQAFRLASESVEGLTLHMYGDETLWASGRGEYGRKVLDLATTMGKRVVIHGTLPLPEMLAELRDMHILLHPATAETCWVSGIEAALAGKCIISRKDCAQAERGFGVPTDGTVEQMASVLITLAKNPELYRAEAALNRAVARQWTWPAVAAAWEAMIEGCPLPCSVPDGFEGVGEGLDVPAEGSD